MKPVSLADITYQQGLTLLALRKQAMDQGRIRRMTPEALENTLVLRDIGHSYVEKIAEEGLLDRLKSGIRQLGQQARTGLDQAKSYYHKLDPASRNTLLAGLTGTGLGAAAGLGQAAMSGDDNYLTSALRGGVAGGALGGGLGLALNPGVADKLYAQIQNRLPKQAPAGQAPAGQAPAGQAPAGQAPAGQAPTRQAPARQAPARQAPAGQAPAGQAPRSLENISPDELNKLYGEASTNAPEIILGAGLTGTAAGTGYGIARSLSRETYDPELLTNELAVKYKSLLGKPNLEGIQQFDNLMGENFFEKLKSLGPERPSTRPFAPAGEMMGLSDDALKQRIAQQLKAQGHTPSLFYTLFGSRSNPAFRGGQTNTLTKLRSLFGKNPEALVKNISRDGWRGFRNPRAIIPSLITALGTGAVGALLGNYQNQQADRAQAQQAYGNLENQYRRQNQ